MINTMTGTLEVDQMLSILVIHIIPDKNKRRIGITMVTTMPTQTLIMQKIESSGAEPHELHKSKLE